MQLKDKVALVTGSAQGIGKAIAEALAKEGVHICVSDINLEGATAAAEELNKLGVKTKAVNINVANLEDVKKGVAKCVAELGKVDILVNNAGITRDALLVRMKEEDWDQVININLKSIFNCTKEVLPLMMKQRSGRIISIASIVGLMGNAGQANYAAAKAGLIGFTKTVAREAATRGITVNAIAPGFIETEMTRKLSEDLQTKLKNLIPMGRFGSPEDVANAVVFLAGPEAAYITGQVLSVNGGMYM